MFINKRIYVLLDDIFFFSVWTLLMALFLIITEQCRELIGTELDVPEAQCKSYGKYRQYSEHWVMLCAIVYDIK